MDKKKIIKLAKKDFEGAWTMTPQTLKKPHHDQEYPRLTLKTGKTHMLYDTAAHLRQAYLNLGFSEAVNPVFIEEDHIYKQFGPEAPAVLDRCFYLAGLPRPDIGIGMDKIEKIEKIGVNLKGEKLNNLKNVFRGYKKGDISGDDLVLEVSKALEVSDDVGLRVLEKFFPEIRELKPVASKTTLRSHMTSGWFITLQNIHNKRPLPIKLFSIDRCFRREQREDASHLMTYHSASCVVVGDEVSLDLGKVISESLLEHFGFEQFKFAPDEKKSKYYVAGTQTEVYGYHPKLNEWVEVATFGLYSPIALAKYGIEKDVLNIGVGVERIAMLLYNQVDIREMVYPETYSKWKLSDREIASMLRINYYPATDEGKQLMDDITAIFKENGDVTSPCEFTAFEGEFLGKNILVKAIEPEKGTKLLGPAAWNKIYINKGDIIGVPLKDIEDEKAIQAMEKGISTGISYMGGIAAYAAYKIEEMVVSGKDEVTVRVPISRSVSDINLRLDEVALNYITSKNKAIDVRGPVFCTITGVLKVGPDIRDIVPSLYLNKENMEKFSSIQIGSLGWMDLKEILEELKHQNYDIVFIEGVMSAFTGMLNEKTPFSSAEIAKAADIPVILASSCSKGGIETAAVDIVGHIEVMDKIGVKTSGVILNRVYDKSISKVASSFITERTSVNVIGEIPKIKMTERGNTPEVEIKLEEFCLNAMDTIEEHLNVTEIVEMAKIPKFKGYLSYEDIIKSFK